MSEQGTKWDQGKPTITLIPSSVILGMARVMAMGATKYGRLNWTKGISYSRLMDATLRHLLAFQAQEDKDAESGESHLLHALVNIAFLVHFTNSRPDLDDRWEPKRGN